MTIRRTFLAVALTIAPIAALPVARPVAAEDTSAAVRKVAIGVPDMH